MIDRPQVLSYDIIKWDMNPNVKRRRMMKRIGIGMLAGLAGTAALTAVVQLERKALPIGQKNNAVFQRKVVKKAEHLLGIPGRLSGRPETAATHASSFAYGLFLWGIGLAGWLPAFGIERVPWKKSPVQAAMPILAHLVYGLAAAAVLRI